MVNKKNRPELADVIQRFGKQFIAKENPSPAQIKALNNIVQCRTSSLGGHKEVCDCCGKVRYSYNSCNDRHCPKCQNTKQAIWVDKLIKDTLSVKHYHIIFTLPHCLNAICLWDQQLFFKIFFRVLWATLHSFGYSDFGCETGAIAILHTWGQNLSLHPHIHCIVPTAGFHLNGTWKTIGKYENYLYPVHQLSKTFKGKFLDSLKRSLKKMGNPYAFDKQIQKAYKKRWVVFSEASFADAKKVINYFGQYTHRVAITNQRILNISDTHVTFIAKDYRDRAIKKPVKLKGVEFLRRFCQHVLPKGFTKIRRFGIYNHTTQRNLDLQFEHKTIPETENITNSNSKETAVERIHRLTGFDITKCPDCKKGKMIITKHMPRIRSPSRHLPTLLLLNMM